MARITVAFTLLSALAWAQGPRAARPPKPPDTGWVQLFNGKDLTGWVNIGNEKWEVEDGTIHGIAVTKDYGYLQTDPNAGVATRIWEFSVPGDDVGVRRQIDDAIAGDYKAKVWYREKYFRIPWIGDTREFVYKVERAG